MSDKLTKLSVCISEPKLGLEPVVPGVFWSPDRKIRSGRLAQLDGDREKIIVFRFMVEERHRCSHLQLTALKGSCADSVKDLEVNHVHVATCKLLL